MTFVAMSLQRILWEYKPATVICQKKRLFFIPPPLTNVNKHRSFDATNLRIDYVAIPNNFKNPSSAFLKYFGLLSSA